MRSRLTALVSRLGQCRFLPQASYVGCAPPAVYNRHALHEFTRVATDVLSRDTKVTRFPSRETRPFTNSPPGNSYSYREEHCTLGFVATCAGCSPQALLLLISGADKRQTVHAR
jgi:hypothetical protein